jgi:hypothetical protein
MARSKTHRLAVVLAVAIIAILVYCGSYGILVTQKIEPHTGTAWARYRVGGTIAQTVFRPIHWLDRQLRPAIWPDGDWPRLNRPSLSPNSGEDHGVPLPSASLSPPDPPI